MHRGLQGREIFKLLIGFGLNLLADFCLSLLYSDFQGLHQARGPAEHVVNGKKVGRLAGLL